MIIYLYLCFATKACKCGGPQNYAVISDKDLGKLEGKIAYSDYIIERAELHIIDVGNAPIEHLRQTAKVHYNHPKMSLTTAQNAPIFSTQLQVLPSIRNGMYQCVFQ